VNKQQLDKTYISFSGRRELDMSVVKEREICVKMPDGTLARVFRVDTAVHPRTGEPVVVLELE